MRRVATSAASTTRCSISTTIASRRFASCRTAAGATSRSTPSGRATVPPNAPRAEPTPADIAAARQLLGTAVRDADGAALGRIEDIVVDMDGLAIRYAVLNVAPAGAGEGRLVPLPMRSFTRQEGGELRASLVRAKLDAAPGFTPTAWPRLGDPVWQARLRSWFATVPMRDATNVKSNQG
jgi:hypothetical protein